jgi:hypothetical protein
LPKGPFAVSAELAQTSSNTALAKAVRRRRTFAIISHPDNSL